MDFASEPPASWQYLDNHRKIQGPFKASRLLAWYQIYLGDETKVRSINWTDAKWQPLASVKQKLQEEVGSPPGITAPLPTSSAPTVKAAVASVKPKIANASRHMFLGTEERRKAKWFYMSNVADANCIQGPFTPAEMDGWCQATPVLMQQLACVVHKDVPDAWLRSSEVAMQLVAPVKNHIADAAQDTMTGVWSLEEVEEMVPAALKAAAPAMLAPRLEGTSVQEFDGLVDGADTHTAAGGYVGVDEPANTRGYEGRGRGRAGGIANRLSRVEPAVPDLSARSGRGVSGGRRAPHHGVVGKHRNVEGEAADSENLGYEPGRAGRGRKGPKGDPLAHGEEGFERGRGAQAMVPQPRMDVGQQGFGMGRGAGRANEEVGGRIATGDRVGRGGGRGVMAGRRTAHHGVVGKYRGVEDEAADEESVGHARSHAMRDAFLGRQAPVAEQHRNAPHYLHDNRVGRHRRPQGVPGELAAPVQVGPQHGGEKARFYPGGMPAGGTLELRPEPAVDTKQSPRISHAGDSNQKGDQLPRVDAASTEMGMQGHEAVAQRASHDGGGVDTLGDNTADKAGHEVPAHTISIDSKTSITSNALTSVREAGLAAEGSAAAATQPSLKEESSDWVEKMPPGQKWADDDPEDVNEP